MNDPDKSGLYELKFSITLQMCEPGMRDKKSTMATIVAWTVYTIANRDEMMPRKPAPAQASGN
jgi:hypothetical protein